jgi:hypothetical protein
MEREHQSINNENGDSAAEIPMGKSAADFTEEDKTQIEENNKLQDNLTLKQASDETCAELESNKKFSKPFGFLLPALYMAGALIYLELVIHFLNYRSVDNKIIYPILFAIPVGLVIGFLAGLFRSSVNKIIMLLLTGFLCILFITQLIYFYVFKVYFSFQTIGMAGDAFKNFWADIVTALKANVGGIILL